MTNVFNHANLLPHIFQYEAWPPHPVSLSSDWEKLSDEKLLDIYQDGNREQKNQAFSAIFNRYRLNVCRYISRFSLSDWRRKELFAEVWIKASVKFQEKKFESKSLNRWLISTTKRTQYELYRKDKKEKEVSDKLLDENYSEVNQVIKKKVTQLDNKYNNFTIEEWLQNQADQRFLKTVNMLENELQREILKLIYFSGITSSKEIGKKFAQKPNTIRKNHHRALEKLAKLLPEADKEIY